MESPFDVKIQIGPCGITCETCFLRNGSVANSANKTLDYINKLGIRDWASQGPEGSDLDWEETEKTLNWMTKYAYCGGCEKGGGPPNCAIRICAKEKGYDICNMCIELDDCTKFDWLGEGAITIKQNLKENIGKTKEDLVKQSKK
jgi:hypothetical protein